MSQEIIITFLASFFIYFLFLGLMVLWVIDGKIKKEQVLHALLSTVLAFGITQAIKILFPTLRPFEVNGMDTFVFLNPFDGAFPSSHTAEAFALGVTVFLHDRKIGWIFLVSALVIGSARVAANVHYPLDIIGGAFIGTLIAVVIDKIHPIKLLEIFSSNNKSKKKKKS